MQFPLNHNNKGQLESLQILAPPQWGYSKCKVELSIWGGKAKVKIIPDWGLLCSSVYQYPDDLTWSKQPAKLVLKTKSISKASNFKMH